MPACSQMVPRDRDREGCQRAVVRRDKSWRRPPKAPRKGNQPAAVTGCGSAFIVLDGETTENQVTDVFGQIYCGRESFAMTIRQVDLDGVLDSELCGEPVLVPGSRHEPLLGVGRSRVLAG